MVRLFERSILETRSEIRRTPAVTSNIVSRGEGNDTVQTSISGGADTLAFQGDHDQLWFARSNNDLIVSVIGQSQSQSQSQSQNQNVTVTEWYASANNHVGQITAGVGPGRQLATCLTSLHT
jgi:hypothetical protein